MSNIILRQNDLFAGEDWQVIYSAFTNINFKNYSFDSIKKSLIEYIRINYPEDFTDWSVNSEFIMIIDVLAYLAESLSYRIDLNARDNFIDTAERRESILRLAKMISYNPKRNYPSRGKVKLSYVKTSQIVIDSNGLNLQNKMIRWNDPQNPDWYEQFILVLNASFIYSNPFGRPIKQVTNNNKNYQLYRVNSEPRTDITLGFSAAVSGEMMNFEIVNMDFDEFGNFFEVNPDPDSTKHIAYISDGAGNSSSETGFFLYFKQGKLDYENYIFDEAIENRVIELEAENINEMDVWVSQINEDGSVITNWTKVPTIENIIYNDIDNTERNIFAVQSRDMDKIAIRFSDGKFGSVPKGIFRVWYRVSNGLEYTIDPMEMTGRTIVFEYKSNKGIDQDSSYDLALSFDLHDVIRNSSMAETSEDIKNRAPRIYYSQSRMVNGEDYNSYPLSVGPLINKLKATNRVYSGQSPFFNNYDPTKRYSSTVEFGKDGMIYKEYYKNYSSETLPTNKTPLEIITSKIIPLLQLNDLNLFFLDKNRPVVVSDDVDWNKVSGQTSVSSGYLTDINGIILVGASENSPYNIISPRSYFNLEKDNKSIWANILSVSNKGNYNGENTGPIILDQYVEDAKLKQIIPPFRQTFNSSEINQISSQIENENTFGLRYDFILDRWIIIDELNVSSENTEWDDVKSGDNTDRNLDASWYIRAQFTANEYRFSVRLSRYIFESENTSRFFFYEDFSGINQNENSVNRSLVSILELNSNLTNTGLLDKEYQFTLIKNIKYPDGYIEPRRIQVIPYDSDRDGSMDDPNSFFELVASESRLFFVKEIDDMGFETYVPTDDILVGETPASLGFYDWENNPDDFIGGYAKTNGLFYTWNFNQSQLVVAMDMFKVYFGRKNINYRYEHFSPENNRIDPAITNVIDMYVLTNAYNKSIQEWKNGTRVNPFPEPELSSVLQDTFGDLNRDKMISDQMVWNPARFTLLFGSTAPQELQTLFKVVKIDSSPLTDNQIKQGVLDAIEEYFSLDNWTFGENIFTSELVSYVHRKMINHVASVIIVPKQQNEFGIRHPGDIYQIRLEFNRLPLNTATVDDIVIVPSASKYNIAM